MRMKLWHLPVDEGAQEQQGQDGNQVKITFAYDFLFERTIDGVVRICRVAESLLGG